MIRFLSKNWFKLAIAIPVIAAGTAATYYFSFVLPRVAGQHAVDQLQQTMASESIQAILAKGHTVSSAPAMSGSQLNQPSIGTQSVVPNPAVEQMPLSYKRQCATDGARWAAENYVESPRFAYDAILNSCIVAYDYGGSMVFVSDIYTNKLIVDCNSSLNDKVNLDACAQMYAIFDRDGLY